MTRPRRPILSIKTRPPEEWEAERLRRHLEKQRAEKRERERVDG